MGRVSLVGRSGVGARARSGTAITSDSLFPGGAGDTQQDAARFSSLVDDVGTRLSGELPDDTWVHRPAAGRTVAVGRFDCTPPGRRRPMPHGVRRG